MKLAVVEIIAFDETASLVRRKQREINMACSEPLFEIPRVSVADKRITLDTKMKGR